MWKVSFMERVYVGVTSDFDPTGYMQPRVIIWSDGRAFQIETVRAFRPAGDSRLLDCYTVVIRGQEKHLYFERAARESFTGRLGRWYVET
jgi:hypothetical protein